MSGTADDDAPAGHAAGELAALHARTAEVRAELASLEASVAQAKSRLGADRAARLVEANEQLVLAALQARIGSEQAKEALEEATRFAGLDALTGLPNRLRLLDRIADALVQAGQRDGRLALLFLDLNDFKDINDTLGHAVGDQVLKLVAESLTAAVRSADMVNRYGGDEFLVLLAEISQASDAVRVAEKIIALLGVPRRIGDHVLRMTASIGISVYPEDGNDVQSLIDHADAAMYHAKAYGLGSFVFHGSDLGHPGQTRGSARGSLSRSLTHYRRSLARSEQYGIQLREANEHLLLAALNAQDLQRAAELALKRQVDQLAVVAHELRTPLTPIRMAATMLGGVPAEQLPRFQAIIEQQVTHLTRLIGDLLDVSRVGVGKLRVARRLVNLLDVLDEAMAASRPALDARLQHLVLRLPLQRVEVHADTLRLVQVFTNLLGNASKFTPEGGEIGLKVQVGGGHVAVSVFDTGIGIPAEVLAHIFDPFVQDARAVVVSGAGLGLGLTVVRELVNAHGGRVAAHSAGTGLGSEFVVTLPLAYAAAPE